MGFFRFFKRKKQDKPPKKIEPDKPPKKSVLEEKPEHKIQISFENNIEKNESSLDVHPVYKRKFPNGLLPGEVFLLDWVNGHEEDGYFPGYFSYKYAIDAQASLKKLMREGFLRYQTPEESLPSLKVTELKDILRANGLKVSGRKKELIERIKENLSEDEYAPFIKKRFYTVTEKGAQVLNDYYYIAPAHWYSTRDGVYDVASAIEYVEKVKGRPTNDEIALALIQQDYEVKLQEKNFNGLRCAVFNMYEYLAKKRQEYEAFDYLLRVFIIDLSGLEFENYLSKPERVLLAPGIITAIKEKAEKLHYDKKKLKVVFSKSWAIIRPVLPFHYLSEETCFQCLLYAFEEDYEDKIRGILKKAYNNLDLEALKQSGFKFFGEWF